MNIRLDASPFNLNHEQQTWVTDTLQAMTTEQKAGQLFCASLSFFSTRTVRHLTQDIGIGGLMIRPFAAKNLQDNLRRLQQASRVPLLISANLENGGNGAIKEGTYFANPEGCSATGDIENGYRLGKVCCREAAAAGVNWGFAPLVDIDMNYQNPITNVRSFGSNRDTVLAMARGYLRAAAEEGVAPTIKHFPGDGVDERDQHLLVSVNSLGYDEWMASFGYIYQMLVAGGAPSVMVGHIAQPAVARRLEPQISDTEALRPASLSRVLITGLLREKFGFNGLVVTDSTLMTGFMTPMPRREALPLAIESGTDMILFNRNLDEDYRYMLEGIRTGLLSKQRLDEAVLRILALKASLGLPARQAADTIVPRTDLMSVINHPDTCAGVRECADKAITLVKDNRQLLPLSAQKTRRVYLNIIENYADNKSAFAADIRKRLEKEGFIVELRKRKLDFNPNLLMKGVMTPTILKVLREVMASTEAFVSRYDLCLIVVNMETVSNATVVRINWKVMMGLGNDIPWYAGELPLVVVSTANPYHLLDIPMAHTYINAYSNNPATIDALFDKLMGRSSFKGISPVDPFCGREDCRL